MDFRYSPDEVAVMRYARESFRARLPLTRLHGQGRAVDAWAALGEDGWLHACLPDSDAHADLAVMAGLARETGALAAGEEFVQNGWLIPRLCASIEDAAAHEQWLEDHRTRPGFVRRADGELTPGAHPGFDRYAIEEADGQWQQLSRWRGDVTIDTLAGLSPTTGRVGAEPEEASRLTLSADADYIRETEAGVSVLRAAALVGLAAEILDRTVVYVGERHQFGKPIGQFQAVKHLCADVHTELQVAWLAVQYAAVCWLSDPLALDQARNQAAQLAFNAARIGAQLHGGMGFTWESDLHWLLKSALDGQLTVGTGGETASAIGATLLETA